MFNSSEITRLVQALKGTSRFSNPKARVVVSAATTRDCLATPGFGSFGSVIGQASGLGNGGVVTITDGSGALFAMTNIADAAEGATIR